DYKIVSETYNNDPEILVIDLMTMDVEEVTRQILSCERTISSSLHGVIVSHAYGIPSVWVEFSNKIFGDGIKYRDYLESVEIPYYQAEFLDRKLSLEEIEDLLKNYPGSPGVGKVEKLCEGLIRVCPFSPLSPNGGIM